MARQFVISEYPDIPTIECEGRMVIFLHLFFPTIKKWYIEMEVSAIHRDILILQIA
jgi:hypothetical protein